MNVDDLTAQLRDLGIRQEGDPVLRQECEPFDLPRERAEAFALWEQLRRYVDQLQQIYPFTKGTGLAAPQIGIARAMSIVRPSQGADAIALINPVVLWQSDDQDEKYEGCLSFFDVRVPVPAPSPSESSSAPSRANALSTPSTVASPASSSTRSTTYAAPSPATSSARCQIDPAL